MKTKRALASQYAWLFDAVSDLGQRAPLVSFQAVFCEFLSINSFYADPDPDRPMKKIEVKVNFSVISEHVSQVLEKSFQTLKILGKTYILQLTKS
eukprot:g83344.t1